LGWIQRDSETGEIITGGHLVLNFDNCTGQNKNNVMMKLLAYLYETKCFSKITFNFLVVGHTKNAADRLFNTLKHTYHKLNIFTEAQLHEILDRSDRVTVVPSKEEDFFDWGAYLDNFYRTLSGQIKQNHIFHCGDESSNKKNQIQMDLRRSALEEDTIVKHNSIKQGFLTRKEYAMNASGLTEAVNNRAQDMLRLKDTLLKNLEAPGINVFKKVELYTKYLCGGIVPLENRNDPLYNKPTAEEMNTVKQEKISRKKFRLDLNEQKASGFAADAKMEALKVLKDECNQAVM